MIALELPRLGKSLFPEVHASQKTAILESRRLFIPKGLKKCMLTVRDEEKTYFVFIFLG